MRNRTRFILRAVIIGVVSIVALIVLARQNNIAAQSLPTATLPSLATPTQPSLATATLIPSPEPTRTRQASPSPVPPSPTDTAAPPISTELPTATIVPPVIVTLTPSVTATQSGGGYPPLAVTPYIVRRGLDVRAFYDPLNIEVGSLATGRLIVLVNSPFGPVEEIPYQNFNLFTFIQPRDFPCVMAVESMFGGVKGIYGINFRPAGSDASCYWRAGRYVLVLVVTKDDMEGTTFVEFEVESRR